MRVGRAQLVGAEVVLTDEDRVQRREADLLVGADIAREEQRGVVLGGGVGEPLGVEGQEALGVDAQAPRAVERTQRARPIGVRAVHVGRVDPRRDRVHGATRVGRPVAAARHGCGAREGKHDRPRRERVEPRIPCRHRDIGLLAARGLRREIQVVVEELAEAPEQVGRPARGGWRQRRLGTQRVADRARVLLVGARQRRHAIGEVRGHVAPQPDARGAHGGVRRVGLAAVDAARRLDGRLQEHVLVGARNAAIGRLHLHTHPRVAVDLRQDGREHVQLVPADDGVGEADGADDVAVVIQEAHGDGAITEVHARDHARFAGAGIQDAGRHRERRFAQRIVRRAAAGQQRGSEQTRKGGGQAAGAAMGAGHGESSRRAGVAARRALSSTTAASDARGGPAENPPDLRAVSRVGVEPAPHLPPPCRVGATFSRAARCGSSATTSPHPATRSHFTSLLSSLASPGSALTNARSSTSRPRSAVAGAANLRWGGPNP